MAFGLRTDFFTTAGDDPQEMVTVHLQDGVVVLTRAAYDDAAASSRDKAAFEKAVRRAMLGKKDEWQRERGPDSELGKNIEAGTPPADHSSDSA